MRRHFIDWVGAGLKKAPNFSAARGQLKRTERRAAIVFFYLSQLSCLYGVERIQFDEIDSSRTSIKPIPAYFGAEDLDQNLDHHDIDDRIGLVLAVQRAWPGHNSVNSIWTGRVGSWLTQSNWRSREIPDGKDNVAINNGWTSQILNSTVAANLIILGQTSRSRGSLSLEEGGVLAVTQIAKGAGIGKIYFDGGLLRAAGGGMDLLASFSTASAASDIYVSANNGYIDTNGFNVSMSAAVIGAGTLVKQGEGTLTLSGDYSGLTGGLQAQKGTIEILGTLLLRPANLVLAPAAGDSASVEVESSGVLRATNIQIGGEAGSNSQVDLAGGSISANSVHIAGAGASSMTLNGGRLRTDLLGIGDSAGSAGTLNVASGSILTKSAGIVVGSADGGIGTLNLTGGSVRMATNHSSMFLGFGSTLNIGTGDSAGNLIASEVSGGGTVNFNHTGDLRFQTSMVGLINVNKLGSGTTNLTAASTYLGETRVEGGTLVVNNTSGSGTGSGNVTVGSGATLGGNGTIGGPVTVESGGFLAPGNAPGRLTLNDSLLLAGGSTLSIEIGGLVAGAGYDQLLVGGPLTLNGSNLNVVLLSGFVPTLNQRFFILDNSASQDIVGTFANIVDGLLTIDVSGHTFAINYQDTDPADASHTGLNDISLTYLGIVPEPETNLLLALSAIGFLLGLAWSKRRARLGC